MRTVFSKEELSEKEISIQNMIKDEIVDEFSSNKGIKEDFILFICQPLYERLSIIIPISKILEYLEIDIIFIPGEKYEIIDFLTDNELDYRFHLYSFNIDLIPLDNDLISLEKENNFKKIYLNNEISAINDFANSFIKLEACYGKIKHKYLKGSKAKIFNDFLIEKEKETNLKTNDEIFGMICIDRSIDFLTPLTNNYTYEGLIDDNFGINKGNIIIDDSYFKEKEFAVDDSPKKLILYSLNSYNNEFFSKIRCMHYLDANSYLYETKKYFIEKAQEPDDNEKLNFEMIQKNIEEINNFVSLYRGPIVVNTKIMNKIIKENVKEENMIYRRFESNLLSGDRQKNLDVYYSDYMSDKKDLNKLLNLMCIESLTQNGIKYYYNLKRDILNIYGFQNIFLLRDLESISLIKDKSSSKKPEIPYHQLCSKLNLINPKFTKENITDCSYIYRGYCPLMLRLIELALQGKWNKIKDILIKMPGETTFPSDERVIFEQNNKIKTIFVVFIGGVSYNEIEGIRYLNLRLKQVFDTSKEKINSRIQLIIVTDEILNKKRIFNSLGKKFEQKYSYKKWFADMIEQKNKKKK